MIKVRFWVLFFLSCWSNFFTGSESRQREEVCSLSNLRELNNIVKWGEKEVNCIFMASVMVFRFRTEGTVFLSATPRRKVLTLPDEFSDAHPSWASPRKDQVLKVHTAITENSDSAWTCVRQNWSMIQPLSLTAKEGSQLVGRRAVSSIGALSD